MGCRGAWAERDLRRAQRGPDAGRGAVRSGARDGAAAARLSVGRRFGLRQPRRTGAPRARRHDAARVLDRSADVPGRIRPHARRVRGHRADGRGMGHRFRSRDRGDHRRRADGHRRSRRAPAHPPADAGQRRQPAQPDSGGTGQGLRFLPVEARVGLLAGGGDAGRAGRCVARRQGTPTARDAS